MLHIPRHESPARRLLPQLLQLLLPPLLSSLFGTAVAAPFSPHDPFKILDPQNWVNPDDMTWDDYRKIPGTNWSDPARRGSSRNFNIALVTLDYSDRPFIVTQDPGSTIFGNPQPQVANLARADVPAYYRDLLNRPGDLNRGHTLHEYWMEDSAGRFGVDLTAFGPYRMPGLAYQYGIDTEGFNPGACPPGPAACDLDLRRDGLGAWRADVGNETADSFELVFILSSGQDESSSWQEFGEMRFQGPEDVPAEFGPPPGSDPLPNYARTRYVNWTSWAAASTIWPNAGDGSSTQTESDGMAVFAHELSHLLDIGDNYNNPYGVPLRRSYTGPWSMMSRGSFGGPGGPHTRWKVPSLEGSSQGSLHTVRDKVVLGLTGNETVAWLSRDGLAASGLVAVAAVTARAVDAAAAGGLLGLNVALGARGDLSPACDVAADVLCDGGGFHNYMVEVVDRMGSDSFAPDAGVMISKTKDVGPHGQWPEQPYQWTVDANPADIGLVDFVRPDGSDAMVTLGDYRQLADALFHAGTRSGSEFEHRDDPNRLHLYVLEHRRDAAGVLSYVVGVRSLDAVALAPGSRGVAVADGVVARGAPGLGVSCVFELANTGAERPADGLLRSDVFRLSAAVGAAAPGWRVELPNALAYAEFGASTWVSVAVAADADAAANAVVTLTAVSESDASVSATAECRVSRDSAS